MRKRFLNASRYRTIREGRCMSNRVVWSALARLIDYSFGELESYSAAVQTALK